MSAGRFLRTFYELNNGEVARARVQPETVAGGWNPVVAGPATVAGSARMRGSNRRIGINARFISGVWQGAAPTGYDDRGVVRVPIMSEGAFNNIALGDVVDYLGAQLEIIGLTNEKIV